jgi:hypothetical protein
MQKKIVVKDLSPFRHEEIGASHQEAFLPIRASAICNIT